MQRTIATPYPANGSLAPTVEPSLLNRIPDTFSNLFVELLSILVGVLNCIDKPYTVTDNEVHYINGSYDQGIFDTCINAFVPASGYSLKFRIFWSATTALNNSLYLYVNGFGCGHIFTDSEGTFIKSAVSNYFDESVFGTEGTYNYYYANRKGTNIKIQSKGDQATATLYSMLCCIYWVKN